MSELKLPELGENIESVEVTAVLVSAGDSIRRDQPVIEVETEKASLEVPSTIDGVVQKVLVKQGQKIQVGQVIITVDAAAGGQQADPSQDAGAAHAPEDEPREKRPAMAAGEPGEEPPLAEVVPMVRKSVPEIGEPAPASPSVRRLARELGIDVNRVPGAGPAGRISAEDVKLYAKQHLAGAPAAVAVPIPAGVAAPAVRPALPDFSRWGEVERKPLSQLRLTAAARLSASWATVPHVTQHDRADITELNALRKTYAARTEAAGGKLTMTAVIIKVAASALRVFPKFNASLDLVQHEVVFKKYVHLGVAVDTDRGLLVPVIRDVDQKNIVQIAAELTELADKARSKRITPDELQGSSFTVTNLGGLGTTYFSPILNWPDVAILGVGRAEVQAVHREGEFAPRLVLPLSISYDHRWIDGADAARFLRWIAEALEQPLLIALEG